MPRSKTDDIMIGALGTRRDQVAKAIQDFGDNTLVILQAELVEIEARLKSIDPTIPSLEEEANAPNPVEPT